MKKTLVALAVMAAAGAASAQSSVTLFGIVDLAVQYGTGNGAGSADRLRLVSSAYNSSRIGFRGVEDLGGGLQASFWLEAGFDADTGGGNGTNTNNQTTGTVATLTNGTQGLVFNRRSTVSLAGNFGEVRLGRDVVPQFWNLTVFDPFGSVGVGSNIIPSANSSTVGAGTTGVRASNSISYFLPRNLGGLYGQAMYYMGENPRTGVARDDGNGYGLRLGYAAGPFDVAVGYGKTEFSAAPGDVTAWNVGGSWKFGMAKVMAQYHKDEGANASDRKGWLIGASAPVGAGEVRASYARAEVESAANPRSSKMALGYVHNLSKRTAVYTTVAHVRNSGGAAAALGSATTAANDKSTGFDLGVRHSF